MSDIDQDLVAQFEAVISEQDQEIIDLFSEGGQFKDLRGLSTEEVEAIYGMGYNFMKQNRFDEAENMFRFACMMSHLEPSYYMALGECLRKKKDYEAAIQTFGYTYTLNVDDPWPVIQTAQCYLGLGDKEQAADALELAQSTVTQSGEANQAAQDRIDGLRPSVA